MKIVILVNYSDSQFNMDFKLSNELIAGGHNVFFAVNSEQFEYLSLNCDMKYRGYSMSNSSDYKDIPIISDNLLI